jgi:predicted house-cleaning NTP pyrophosphatase (Maf/HAM1 superfamily)
MMEPRIYLASRSPRRRELLTQIGVRFDLLLFRGNPREDAEVSEDCLPGETPDAYVLRVAQAKARFGADLLKRRPLVPHPVLAADTTLDVDGEVIAKPRDTADAEAILARLSGRRHRVLTAIAMARGERIECRLSVSEVRFRSAEPPGKSAATCKPATRWTRPAPTASRAAPRSSSSRSAARIPASSACRCAKPRSCCENSVIRSDPANAK